MSVSAKNSDITAIYERSTGRKLSFLALLAALLIFISLVATAVGAAGISLADVCSVIAMKLVPGLHLATQSDLAETIVMELRLPRIILAVLTGMSLGCAGAVMQGVLRNPLVSPMTLGVSSGAAFGAALAILLGADILGASLAGEYTVALSAFIFGSLTISFIYGISRIRGTSTATLLLAGVALGYLYSAGLSMMQYISNDNTLRQVTLWLMGGLWGAQWFTDIVLLPIVLVCIGLLMRYAWDLNAFGAGEEVARSLGVNVRAMIIACLALATLITSSTIAFTGVIGFIGLIAPHICRMIIGADHRFLIPGSCLFGGVTLLLADTLARNVLAPVEIPVGIVTSLIGVPFFVYLLLSQKKRWW
jgi:iron complex transport system permease protein